MPQFTRYSLAMSSTAWTRLARQRWNCRSPTAVAGADWRGRALLDLAGQFSGTIGSSKLLTP